MASDGTANTGATNHFGELLTGNGDDTHDGLIITDGAAVPTALGVNPFATITAMAERSVRLTADKMGLTIDYTTENGETFTVQLMPGLTRLSIGILNLFDKPAYPLRSDSELIKAENLINETKAARVAGIGFLEVMSGFIHIGDFEPTSKKEDFEVARGQARGLSESARFILSVKAWNTETSTLQSCLFWMWLTHIVIHRPDHSAMLTGTFMCAALPGNPFMVHRGDFQLFNNDLATSGNQNLTYTFSMTGINGEEYHFHGYKVVNSGVALNPLAFWRATTTLYVTISRLNGPIVARGILDVRPNDFLSEIYSIVPSGRNAVAKAYSAFSFMSYFAKSAATHLFTPFSPLQYPPHSYVGFNNPTPVSSTIVIKASDGVKTYMQMWEADPYDPSLAIHDLFMIPGASVDHQIFALETIPFNAVQYFTRAGYRVWVLTHRIGMTMQAQHSWTTFDARLDIRAALEYIRSARGNESIYTIAHCMGSVAFSCGLLDGTIPAAWIKGITCSQTFMNPRWATLNLIKVLSPVHLDTLYKAVGGNWFSCTSSTDDSLLQRTINQLLRFYPTVPEEMCTNVACHRGSFIFGRLWNHRNLNLATHSQTHRFFGGVSMTLEHLLMHDGTVGYVTTNFPLAQRLTTSANLKRLKGIPMFFFSGADNKVLSPESTQRSYEILREEFGAAGYEREVVEGYGHLDCWMGTQAYKDVYPMVRERVDCVVRGVTYKYRGD